MARVRFKEDTPRGGFETFKYEKGEEYDLPDALAARYVSVGSAERVDETPAGATSAPEGGPQTRTGPAE